MSVFESLGDRWGWPAAVGMVAGVGAGFYLFWTGQLLQVAPHRAIEILTALGTLLGSAAAAIAAWVSFASARDARSATAEALEVTRESACAARDVAAAAAAAVEVQRRIDAREDDRARLELDPELVWSAGCKYDPLTQKEEFCVSVQALGPVDPISFRVRWTGFGPPKSSRAFVALTGGLLFECEGGGIQRGELRTFSLAEACRNSIGARSVMGYPDELPISVCIKVCAEVRFHCHGRWKRDAIELVLRLDNEVWSMGIFDHEYSGPAVVAKDFDDYRRLASLGNRSGTEIIGLPGKDQFLIESDDRLSRPDAAQ